MGSSSPSTGSKYPHTEPIHVIQHTPEIKGLETKRIDSVPQHQENIDLCVNCKKHYLRKYMEKTCGCYCDHTGICMNCSPSFSDEKIMELITKATTRSNGKTSC